MRPTVGDVGPPPRRRRGSLGLIIVCVGLALLAAGSGLRARSAQRTLDRERETRAAIETVVREVVEGLLTYDYRDLEPSRLRVLTHATGRFRKEYEEAFAGGVPEAVADAQLTSKGTIKEIFVSDVRDGLTTAIVVADAETNGTAGPAKATDTYLQIELVKVEGRWRVDGVRALETAGQPAPATTTTTAKRRS